MRNKIKNIFNENKSVFLLIFMASFISTIISIFIITAGRIFVDRFLTYRNIEWYYPFIIIFFLLTVLKMIADCVKCNCLQKFYNKIELNKLEDMENTVFMVPIIIDFIMTIFYFFVMVSYNPVLALVSFLSLFINFIIYLIKSDSNYFKIAKIITVFANLFILCISFYLVIYEKITLGMIFSFQGFVYFVNLPIFNLQNNKNYGGDEKQKGSVVKITFIESVKYISKLISGKDILKIMASIFFIAILGLFIPRIYKIIFLHFELHLCNFSKIMIFSSIILLTSVSISMLLMIMAKDLVIENIHEKKLFSSQKEIVEINEKVSLSFLYSFVKCFFSGVLSFLFSILYIFQIYRYITCLVGAAITVPIIILFIFLFTVFVYRATIIIKYYNEILTFLGLSGTLILFAESFKNNICISDFMALIVSYKMIIYVYFHLFSEYVKLPKINTYE